MRVSRATSTHWNNVLKNLGGMIRTPKMGSENPRPPGQHTSPKTVRRSDFTGQDILAGQRSLVSVVGVFGGQGWGENDNLEIVEKSR